MAFSTNYRTLPGVTAGADLSAKQFHIVKVASTAGQVVLNGTSLFAGNVVGVLMNKPASGEEAEVALDGIVKLIVATSTIVAGDPIGSNSTSKGTDGSTTDNGSRIGKALGASAAANDIISVLLTPGGFRSVAEAFEDYPSVGEEEAADPHRAALLGSRQGANSARSYFRAGATYLTGENGITGARLNLGYWF